MKPLPPRFQKIADCIVEGLGEKEMPARTGLTFPTVRSYVRTMYKRMGVHNRAQFVAKLLSSPCEGGPSQPLVNRAN